MSVESHHLTRWRPNVHRLLRSSNHEHLGKRITAEQFDTASRFHCSEIRRRPSIHCSLVCVCVCVMRLMSPSRYSDSSREAGRGNFGGGAAVESGERVTLEMSTSKPRGDMITGEAGGDAGEL